MYSQMYIGSHQKVKQLKHQTEITNAYFTKISDLLNAVIEKKMNERTYISHLLRFHYSIAGNQHLPAPGCFSSYFSVLIIIN